jgi:3-dehydroquinate dehydratase
MIATIRTHNEGGKLTISDADYGKTYQAYLKQPLWTCWMWKCSVITGG